MKGFIAKRSCSFGGVDYSVGEFIPHEAVMPNRVAALKATNTIAEVNMPEEQQGEIMVEIPIINGDELFYVGLTTQEIIDVVTIMQQNTETATSSIAEITNHDQLIMLDTLESRKGVKEVVKKRAEALIAEEEDRIAAEKAEAESHAEVNAVSDAQEGASDEQQPPDDTKVVETENEGQAGGEA